MSEHSKVYWDLSNADDEIVPRGSSGGGGKFKISLQTIHQKEEMQTSSNPSVSIKARVVRRLSSETSLLSGGNSPRNMDDLSFPGDHHGSDPLGNTPSPSSHKTEFHFNFNSGSLTVTLDRAVPVLQENITKLKATSITEQSRALTSMLSMIEEAWATPSIGRDLATGLCDVLRTDGGLDILLDNCSKSPYREIKLGSAKVLEQTMTVGNRDVVASKGLEVVLEMAKKSKDDVELMKATTGILESLFKHSERTCTQAIKHGGLDSILYSCRMDDTTMLRNCAEALANLAMYGGAENQQEMIKHRTAEWLFPLAFSNDDNIRYYAFLAITALSANKEIETAVAQSGTLGLVKPFILTHDPADFARSDMAHIHGQSKDWLGHLLPLLESKVEEAQSLAAFHFAMEAHIKAEQGKREVVCITLPVGLARLTKFTFSRVWQKAPCCVVGNTYVKTCFILFSSLLVFFSSSLFHSRLLFFPVGPNFFFTLVCLLVPSYKVGYFSLETSPCVFGLVSPLAPPPSSPPFPPNLLGKQ